MAIDNGSLVEFSVNMLQQGQTVTNVWQYEVVGALGAIDPPSLVDAYWQYVKVGYRSLVDSSFGRAFYNVKLLELNVPSGAYAEFSIPAAEGTGTRAETSSPDWRPSFAAAGVRLAVGSRVTRPGQKRFGFLLDIDSTGNAMYGSIIGLIDSFMASMVGELVLAVPSLGTTLQPIVCKKDATGLVTAHQDVTGYIINPNATTQNSRKVGRGI